MKNYSRIFRYISRSKGSIFLYFFFILLSIIFSVVSVGMLMPFLDLIFNNPDPACAGCGTMNQASNNPVIQQLRDFLSASIAARGKIATLGLICLLIIVFILLKNFFLYLSYYILNPLKNRVVNHLREEIYLKILSLPIGFFTEKRKGDLMSRMTNDVSEVENSVVGALEGWIRDPLTIIITLVALLLINVQLTLFLLVLIPIMGLVIGRITRSLKRHSAEVAHKHGETLSVLEETLGGLRVIKAFNVETVMRSRFFKNNEQLLLAKNRIGYRRDMASPLSELMGVTLFCAVLYYGGQLVLGNQISLQASTFLGYLGLFYNIISPAKSLSTAFSNMQKGSAAIARIEEILHTPVTVNDNVNGRPLHNFMDRIELRKVNFYYEGKKVLDDINLVVEKGKTVALVGASGAGKSTLADLVPRFHDVSDGEVLIDGVNIREYSLASVRNQMSIVTQEPILFNDSIANNIRLGKPDATDQEVEEAAKIANAHSFIVQKEAGYQTNIGDRGSKLSGGERQRLTIARAVLKNPPILILDEATSSLDTESERLVQDAISNMMQHRTSIVIAHRLSTIRHASEIIVLREGRIVERGTHETLLALNGYYKKLVEMQELR